MMTRLNTNSFDSKLLALQSKMLGFAMQLTSDREEAKDLLQETTLKVLMNRDKYYENVNFKGWVFTIMHNIFANNYRRMSRTHTIIDQTENMYLLNMPQSSGFSNPDSTYTLNEIIKTVKQFGNSYKVPFTMHVSGYKYEEIAQKLQLPIGTVKSRIFFARKKLQEQLSDYRYIDRN